MSKELIPSFSSVERLPEVQVSFQQDRVQGVHISVDPERLDWILDKIKAWFEDYDHVVLVGSGVTAKNEMGFILLEWEGYDIDPLFLKILEHEDLVEDYGVYGDEEDDDAYVA